MQTCILIGAGEFHEPNILMDEDDYVIAVDGGYRYCQQLNIKPDLLVADFDSLEYIPFEPVHASLPEKDDSDMMLAIKDGLEKGYRKFQLYGALGGRFEHSYANIQCLAYLLEQGANAEIIDYDTRITLIDDQLIFEENQTGYLSVFAYSQQAEISLINLKYPLDHALVTSAFPLGLDNEFIGKQAHIQVHDGQVLVIYHIPVEICAGCIILNEYDQVCITTEHGYHQIPKGHREGNETLQECALREIKEEIGLAVEIIEGFEIKTNYKMRHRNHLKEITFFLAKTNTQKVVCQQEEIDGAQWLDIDEAIELVERKNWKDVLSAAKKYLKCNQLSNK